MKPLIISVAGGNPGYNQQSLVTLKSYFQNVRPAGVDMLWLTNDMPPKGEARCKKFGVEVHRVNANFADYGCKQRHWHELQWLAMNEHKGYTHVLTIDARDVVFQANPFDYLELLKPGVIATAEASNYGDCPWNKGDAQRLLNELRKDCQVYDPAWPVVNGGHLAGPVRDIMWALMARVAIDCRGGGATDQATLGFMANWTKVWNTLFKVVSVDEPWICHGHFFRNIAKQVQIKDNLVVCNSAGLPFKLFHQWDRGTVPHQVTNKILETYGTE